MNRGQGWRLRVAHETRFDYDGAARASYNELRLTPRTEQRQTALETRVVTIPAAQQYSYVDYWGTHVVAFNVDRRHEMLSITGNALVDTLEAESPEDCSWDEAGRASLTTSDHLGHRFYTRPTPELAGVAESLRAPVARSRRCGTSSGGPMTRCATDRGVTGVHTTAAEAFVGRGRGVPGLRPPRARPDPVRRRTQPLRLGLLPPRTRRQHRRGSSRGRATPGSKCGRGSGGRYDPTNDVEVGERHIAVGRGRDYADVPPSRGSTPATRTTPCG